MNKKGVVLLSGGLDSTLALRIMQEQGVEMEAINVRTAFECCKETASDIAREFGVKLTIVSTGDDYFKLVEKPKHGWGRAINPCVDCRAYMFRQGRKLMDLVGASFIVTGEVVGQRPNSQMKHHMKLIEEESDLVGRILRPLSAKLLDPTIPELEGIVDREKLYGISGRSRKELLALAAELGVKDTPTPSTGCALTEPGFAKKVRDVFANNPDYERWDFELIQMGRHFRLSRELKVVLGKNEVENERLKVLRKPGTVLYVPENFAGPSALVTGPATEDEIHQAVRLIARFAGDPGGRMLTLNRYEGSEQSVVEMMVTPASEQEMESIRV